MWKKLVYPKNQYSGVDVGNRCPTVNFCVLFRKENVS